MPKQIENPHMSEQISAFCSMVVNAKSDFEWNSAEVLRLDQLTQDLLHKLELEDLGYSERAKIATQLSTVRKLRRQSKDTATVLQPFIEFVTSEKGKQMMNLVNEALGKTRKAEEKMQNRIYRYRVLDGEIGGVK